MKLKKEGSNMSNIEKYNRIFMDALSVKESDLNEKLVYQSIPDWDSVGHMGIVADLEDAFDIMFETDDIIDFNSYEKGKEILEKYNIKF